VDYAEKYYPDLIENLSSTKSPMQIQGPITKTYFAKQKGIDPAKIYTVAIMPCTAKKFEAVRDDHMYSSGYQDTDLVLTTRELARMIKAAGIDFNNLPETEADDPLGEYSGGGTIFGATGGVMEAAIRTAYYAVTGENLKDVNVTSVRGIKEVKKGEVDIKGRKVRVAVVHGMVNAQEILEEVRECKKAGKPAPYDFVEFMACRGGCVAGGGQPYGADDEVRKERAAGLYQDDTDDPVRCCHDNPSIKKLYKEFLGAPLSELSEKYLHTAYKQVPVYKA
jgi:NADH-quinone oxidoreductase subunit G